MACNQAHCTPGGPSDWASRYSGACRRRPATAGYGAPSGVWAATARPPSFLAVALAEGEVLAKEEALATSGPARPCTLLPPTLYPF